MNAGMLDLRVEAAQLAPAVGDLPELTAAERHSAVATWRGRMVNEHISSRVFGVLLGQAMAASLSARRQTQIAEFACEELRHARQCASVVAALGGEAVAPLPALPGVPSHSDAEPLEALLRNVVSVCCLAETVAVALIRAETLEIGPPQLLHLLEGILADEVGHARFGWTLLDELAPLDPPLRERLSAYLETALTHLVEHELLHLPARGDMGARAAQVGVCSGLAARQLLFDTIDTVILPGLARHGLQPRDSWRHRQGPLNDEAAAGQVEAGQPA